MKIGDKVTRRWKPALGIGTVTHILGDKYVVMWNNNGSTSIEFEKLEHLKAVNESR